MANATRTEFEAMVMVPGVRLDLTMDEAQTLIDVMAKIGGLGTRRAHTDAILKALEGEGFVYPVPPRPDLKGGIQFEG